MTLNGVRILLSTLDGPIQAGAGLFFFAFEMRSRSAAMSFCRGKRTQESNTVTLQGLKRKRSVCVPVSCVVRFEVTLFRVFRTEKVAMLVLDVSIAGSMDSEFFCRFCEKGAGTEERFYCMSRPQSWWCVPRMTCAFEACAVGTDVSPDVEAFGVGSVQRCERTEQGRCPLVAFSLNTMILCFCQQHLFALSGTVGFCT